MEDIIVVKDIWREFKASKRGAGFKEAIKNLFSRKYEKKKALKGVSLNVQKGEIIGLIGPNGAGKSTLIKILTGVMYPSSGFVKVLKYIPWKDRVKYVKEIGVIFGQKSQLYSDIPALDTFELHRELYDIPKNEFEKRLKYMIGELGVEDVVRKPVRQLSLGERMRCEIILTLLHNPKIAFLDEPTIGLDVIAKDKIRDFIKEFNKENDTTFIITTHDMSDIEKLCKRVVIINYGLIIYDGLLSEICKQFANKKIVDCKFSEPILARDFNLGGCKVIRRRQYQLVLELDLSKVKINKFIDYIVSKYGMDLEDIIIQDPPIEEIIKLVYKEKK
jgi:ABC-2 type transport system ATP-binding protein